jgi:PAS domain S-box-containing protein
MQSQHRDTSLFELLVRSVRDYAIYALDASGHIVSWNLGAEQLKGYAAEEVAGRHFSMFFTEPDLTAGRPAALLAEAVARGSVADEGWRVRRDGAHFWASVVITALRGPDGTLLGFAKVTRDMTERRANAESLRLRERQLSDAQELAGLGSWEWDVAANRVTWTEELYRIYGLDSASFGANFEAYLGLVHPDDRDRVIAVIQGALAAGDSFEFEERIRRPDGEERVLRSRGRVVRDEAGQATKLTGACLDITDLRRAEQRAIEAAREEAGRRVAEDEARRLAFLLRASEALSSSLSYGDALRRLAELAAPEIADWCAIDLLMPDGVLRRVAVQHKDPDKVRLAQEYMERYPPDPAAPGGEWQVIRSGEPQWVEEVTDEMLVAAARDDEQLRMIRALDIRSAVTVPLLGKGGALGSMTLVQSESGRRITANDARVAQELGRHAALAIENARLHEELAERNASLEEQAVELETQADELQEHARRTDELLAELRSINEKLADRTREAEQANKAKSDFLAAMSHELRTPLNAIVGYADLLDLEVDGPLAPRQHEAISRIKRSQRTLLRLIDDVLSFAKLGAGKLEFRLRAVPVGELLADVESVIGPQMAVSGLSWSCASCDAALSVHCEPERVQQILLNLLTNAVKFTQEGGGVSLAVEPAPEEVRFHVSDTGRGIPPERLDTIFAPFVQVEPGQGSASERGVGLGLAISRELAEAMGGELAVHSEVGRGSTFTLTLPRAADASAVITAADVPAGPTAEPS